MKPDYTILVKKLAEKWGTTEKEVRIYSSVYPQKWLLMQECFEIGFYSRDNELKKDA